RTPLSKVRLTELLTDGGVPLHVAFGATNNVVDGMTIGMSLPKFGDPEAVANALRAIGVDVQTATPALPVSPAGWGTSAWDKGAWGT
ncbi:MAG: hypothetical protein ACK5YI_06665, partial [Rhodospirillales bacterium]